MSIELTTEQSRALAAEGGEVLVIDLRTRQTYRLIREDVYQQMQTLYDASLWTAAEMAALAGVAFGELDDDDSSHYLREPS